MAFDFQKLIEDPQFQLGLGLMGASSPSMAPFGEMAKQMQGIQKQKMDMEVAKARLEQERRQTEAYEQQIAESARSRVQQQAAMERFGKMVEADFSGGRQPQQQQPQAIAAPQAQQALQQQQAQIQGQQQPDPVDAFYETKIIGRESRGEQYDPIGQPLLGPAIPGRTERAVGRGQILPSTAPEAAKLAGLEWNKALFNRQRTGVPALDQEAIDYNTALGKAYFKKQVQDFGALPYASAAYFSGPDNVRKAIAAADKIGKPDMWLSFMGPKARDYVAKTSGTDLQLPPEQPPLPPTTPMGLSSKGMKYIVGGGLLGIAGVKGSEGIIRSGEAMQREEQQRREAGFTERKVSTEEQQLGINLREEAHKTGESNIPGMTPEQRSEMTKQIFVKQHDTIQTNYEKLLPVPEQLMSIKQARENLKGVGPFIGSGAETKLGMAKLINNNLGFLGVQVKPEEVGNAEALRTSLITPVLTMLKQIDSTPTVNQQQILQSAVGQLSTDPKGLEKILDILEQRMTFKVEQHQKMYKQAKERGIPFAADFDIDISNLPETIKLDRGTGTRSNSGRVQGQGIPQGWKIERVK